MHQSCEPPETVTYPIRLIASTYGERKAITVLTHYRTWFPRELAAESYVCEAGFHVGLLWTDTGEPIVPRGAEIRTRDWMEALGWWMWLTGDPTPPNQFEFTRAVAETSNLRARLMELEEVQA